MQNLATSDMAHDGLIDCLERPMTCHCTVIGKAVPVLTKLGPMPRHSLAAMVDYGLNDQEIARYYSMTSSAITRLRIAYGIV